MYCWSIASILFLLFIIAAIIAIILWIIVACRDFDGLGEDEQRNYRRLRSWAITLSWIALLLALIVIILGAYSGGCYAQAAVVKYHHAHKACHTKPANPCDEGVAPHGVHQEHHETATSVMF